MDKLLSYLEEFGLTLDQIHDDENGSFYFSIEDNGEVSNEGYSVESKRIYLPADIQKLL